MLVQIKVINIFCVPILASIKKSYLVFSRSDKLSYCLSVTQPNIATSLIEKRTNEYVGRSIFRKIGTPVVILIRKTIAT